MKRTSHQLRHLLVYTLHQLLYAVLVVVLLQPFAHEPELEGVRVLRAFAFEVLLKEFNPVRVLQEVVKRFRPREVGRGRRLGFVVARRRPRIRPVDFVT